MPEIDHELKIDATPEQVFAALSTPDGVKAWHTPHATGSGEVGTEWVFRYANHPEFAWEIVTSEPDRVIWRCTRGPGDSVGTTATFTVTAADTRTLLTVRHAGWPGTHGNFRKCNTTWGVLLHHLRDYVETGDAVTAFE
ncbi:SRPBCC domain-containing protein [Mycolicibacterium sp.]|uniref:SRPBCC family protein n=1 Tax=Mycolicibacterium sp. TaxID=2320850 RepID=UPI001A324F3D|nr:SRPBCC domain-containing protein [Mycolicibacterium sp.]MBJ7339011.1 SRPBCC domain-containing protein [Mycolicibacterium sp.]